MKIQQTVAQLFKFLLLDKRDIKLVIVYSALTGLLSLFLPLGAQSLFNNINYGTLLQPVIIIAVVVLIMLGFSSFFMALQTYLIEIIQRRIFARSSLSIAKVIPQIDEAAFSKVNRSDLINRFFETLHLQKIQAALLMDGLDLILQTLIGLLLLAFYHPYLLVYDLILIITLYFIIFKLGKGALETSLTESKKKYGVATWLEDITKNKKLFSTSTKRDFAMKKADERVNQYLGSRHKHFKILFRQHVFFYGLFAVASALLLGLGGYLVIKGELTLGQLIAVEIIVSGVLFKVTKLGKYLESGYDMVASYDKLSQIFSLPLEKQTKENSATLPCEELKLKKANTSDALLKIRRGDTVCIFGKSGSGKTRLSNILGAYITDDEYTYEIDGVSSLDVAPSLLREQIVSISEKDHFSGSFIDNITMGMPHELSKITEDLKAMGLTDENFTHEGFNTFHLKGEDALPDHVKVIMAITRSLSDKTHFLIINQILDGLDDKLIEKIIHHLQSKHQTLGLIVITSRPVISDMFETVYEMNQLT
jgi:putative ABC transport system ATP-binding protein